MVEFSEVEFSDDEEEDDVDGLEPAEGFRLAFSALSQAFELHGRSAKRPDIGRFWLLRNSVPLPEAVSRTQDHFIQRRNAFERAVNKKLNEEVGILEAFKDRRQGQLAIQPAKSGELEGIKLTALNGPSVRLRYPRRILELDREDDDRRTPPLRQGHPHHDASDVLAPTW